LLGDFAIFNKNDRDYMSKLPDVIVPGLLNSQGFTYFGGKILLSKNIDDGQYEISTKNMGPASIIVNGKPMNFPPYKTTVNINNKLLNIEVAFTRENTFGTVSLCNTIEGIKELKLFPFEVRKIK